LEGLGSSDRRHVISQEAALAGILTLLIDAREARIDGDKDPEKIEVLLSRAGLSNDDIGAVTGKRPDTVRVALSRAKPKKKPTA
jgi:DNA-directed RNA polymerase specialized sigma24 family protein